MITSQSASIESQGLANPQLLFSLTFSMDEDGQSPRMLLTGCIGFQLVHKKNKSKHNLNI